MLILVDGRFSSSLPFTELHFGVFFSHIQSRTQEFGEHRICLHTRIIKANYILLGWMVNKKNEFQTEYYCKICLMAYVNQSTIFSSQICLLGFWCHTWNAILPHSCLAVKYNAQVKVHTGFKQQVKVWYTCQMHQAIQDTVHGNLNKFGVKTFIIT